MAARKKPAAAKEPTYLELRKKLDGLEDKKSANSKKAREIAQNYRDKESALEDEAKPLREAMRRMEADALGEAAPVLLTLVPEHSRSGCSDDDFSNYDEGCARCSLLYVQRYPHLACEFEVKITLTNRPYD